MRRIFFSLLVLSFSAALFAQDDINLLDLIRDQPTDSVAAVSSPSSTAASSEYDWRNHRHSITFTAGTPSLLEKGLAGFMWLLSMGQDEPTRYIGPYSLEYDYNILRWLRIGGRFGYMYSVTPGYLPEYHVFYNDARLDFTYLNKRKVKLYSGFELGLGLSYNKFGNHDVDNFVKPMFVFGICPLGLQAGGDHVYFMAECNIGNTDFFRIGIGGHF